MTPEAQVVKVETVTEDEAIITDTGLKISWFTLLVANMSVTKFPDTELPLIADIVNAFLNEVGWNTPKMVKGGLLVEYGIGNEDMRDVLFFLRQDRIEVEGVVLGSET